jgi:hypothetical protein
MREITIRDSFINVVNLLKNYATDYIAITTNWDTVVDKVFEDNVIHLHGIFLNPLTLYLPTEIVYEPYRSKNQRKSHLTSHLKALYALSEADSLLIYGLSLSPLDAELSNILYECLNGEKIKYIIIVDPCYELVIKRMQLHIQKPNSTAKLFGVYPEKLHELLLSL